MSNRSALKLAATAKEKKSKQSSLIANKHPIFQDLARFRGIIFDAKLKPHDITMSQGWVLVHLWREDGLRQSELADRMDIATVTTSKLIDKLEARGYVERKTDDEDRRSNRVYASKKGIALVKTMTKIVHEVDDIANQGISEKELTTTLKVLDRMRKNLKTQIAQK